MGTGTMHDGANDSLTRPPLFRDGSFWGLTATQFLGAFNDNVFKQQLLLLFVAVPTATGSMDLQGVATIAFSIPFVLFSGFAGYLSDRYSKRRVIVLSKVAEIVVMAAGVLGFIAFGFAGLPAWLILYLMIVLFAMGGQSAFFGPGKYGILPELFRKRDLPPANSLILMTTFMAVIFGSALAGLLMDVLDDRLWIGGLLTVAIAAVGTWTSLAIRKTPVAAPELRFSADCVAIPSDVRQAMRDDRQLTRALIATSLFWTGAALVQLIVNTVGKNQLGLEDRHTSLMVTGISIGIAIGGALGAPLLGHGVNLRASMMAGWAVVVTLVAISFPGSELTHWLGFRGMFVALTVLGAFTSIFSIPLQVLMQARPPEALKGRVIATQNLLNWVGICGAGLIYQGADSVLAKYELPPSWNFLAVAAILSVMLLVFFPKFERQSGPVITGSLDPLVAEKLRRSRNRRKPKETGDPPTA